MKDKSKCKNCRVSHLCYN